VSLDDGDVLDRVAIFPLPTAVLFPATLMPLHVFEPRYLMMLDDLLATEHRYLGVAQLTGDWRESYGGRPPVCDVFGLGQVVQHELTPDGRRDILVRGVARATILAELPPEEPFRTVRCRVLASGEEIDALAGKMATVRSLLATWLAGVPGLDMSRASSLFDPSAPAGQVLDSAATALPIEADVKQALLGDVDLCVRADRMIEALIDLPPVIGQG
jgi:uncharacterized protein